MFQMHFNGQVHRLMHSWVSQQAGVNIMTYKMQGRTVHRIMYTCVQCTEHQCLYLDMSTCMQERTRPYIYPLICVRGLHID